MTSSATLPESLEIPDSTKLPLLTGDYSFPVHVGLPVTIVIAIVAAIVLSKTVFGLQLRAVGFNPIAASRAGISYSRMVIDLACHRRRARRSCRRLHAVGRAIRAQRRLLFGLWLRRSRGRLAGARFGDRGHRRGAVVRLPSFRRHQHGNGRRRADRAGHGDPGLDRRHARGRGIFHGGRRT